MWIEMSPRDWVQKRPKLSTRFWAPTGGNIGAVGNVVVYTDVNVLGNLIVNGTINN